MPASRAILAELDRRQLRHDKAHDLSVPVDQLAVPAPDPEPAQNPSPPDLAPLHISPAEEATLEAERPKKRRGSPRQAD